MQIRFTPEQESWRQEVRDFLDAELPPEMAFDVEFDEDEALWEFSVNFTRKVGAKGWLGLNWPTEYGGLGRPPIDRMIMSEEFAQREAPLCGSIGWGLAAGCLLAGGSDEQKRHWLPQLGRMDLHVAEGLSEPGAGSDLASLKTTARRDGNDWLIDGQKTYTTWGTHAEWLLTAAREQNSSRHHGITMFLVPYNLPGVSMSPMPNLGGGMQNHTFLDQVRVPEEYMIGGEGGGWNMIMNAFYGGGIHAAHSYYERSFQEVLKHCKESTRGGRRLIEDPLVRQQLGRLALMVEQMRVLTYASVSNHNNQKAPEFGGALGVVVGKEMRPAFFEICQEIMGPLGQLKTGRFAPLGGQVEAWYRHSFANHAGGTSQVKRMVLATRGLGLPR